MAEKMTPRELLAARGQAGEGFEDVVAVRVGKDIFDLLTPIPSDATFTPIRASEPAGLEVIRHSSAHVMADAVQRLFPGTKVTFGPAVEDGFYYDFHRPEGAFTEADLAKIEKTMRDIVKRNSRFKREIVTRDQALELFHKMGETFKAEHVGNIPADQDISLYRHGGISNGKSDEWVDLCAGPHVPNTGFLKAIKLTSVAGAYWRGDEKNPQLQRIYGTAFHSQEALDEHFKHVEEAKARDHRKLGKELDLFLFDEVAPAMPFFLPKGAYVYNALLSYMRSLYDKYGYDEVITPQAFDPKLFRTSGHLGNYNENMYRLWTEDAFEGDLTQVDSVKLHAALGEGSFALKPMNCPSHCIIFGSRRRSYRELPWRVADFGRLHRYERGGVVHGLSRVRSFCQDDAHIFCREDQVSTEIEAFIRLLYEVYEAFKFTDVTIKLALRPDKRMGTDAEWDRSEGALREGLQQAGLAFEELENEGAFYGPKIEFHVKDALKRSWQLGTIQFDPNLPARFDLSYVGEDGNKHRPVMLHRAILGSLERFFSVYLEHCGGNFPAWIAPRQVIVLTVSEKTDEYAVVVKARLAAQGFRVDSDFGPDKLGAKIRNARLARYPFLCVVGAKEAETDSVGVRSQERGELGAMTVAAFSELLRAESVPPSRAAPVLGAPLTNPPPETSAMRRSRLVASAALSFLVACGVTAPPEGTTDEVASAETTDSLVITEIFYNPSDPTILESSYEWFEVYNPTSKTIDLGSLRVSAGNSLPAPITAMNGGKVGPKQLAVVTSRAGSVVDTSKVKGLYDPSIRLSNAGMKLALSDPAGIVVDSVSYDDFPPWPQNVAGRAIQLTAAAFTSVANNDAFNWCGAGVPYGSWAGPDGNVPQLGTPGTANGNCGLLGSAGSTSGGETVLSPPSASGGNGGSGGSGNGGAASGKAGASGTGAAGSPAGDGYPLTGELVITELMIHPTASADTGEWFEVYNPTGKSFDLRGIQIVSNASAHVIAGAQPIVASPGAYVVFAHSESSVANGGLPASVFAYPAEIGLADDVADGLALRVLDEEGNIVRTIDEASYAGTNLGRWTGASRALAPGLSNAVENDAEAAWCPATSTYGVAVPKDHGTPGKANDPCDAGGAGGQDAGGTGGSDGEGGAGGSDSEGGTAGASGSKAGNAGMSAQGGNASKGGNAGKGGSPAKGGAGGDKGEGGGGSAPAGGAASGKGGKGGGATASKGGASAVGGGAASAQGGASGELALTNGGNEGCGCRIAGAPDTRGPADGLLAASFAAASALLLRERGRRRA